MTRFWKRLSVMLGVMIASLAFTAAPAAAQATRTWVSGVGDDVNPCSRTAPCKTFAGAISKTAVGGEINCLDPGGFGTLTITKSITIDCSGTFGSVLAAGTNGFTINDVSSAAGPNTARVILRGLTINGASLTTSPGSIGINFVSGASLTVENVIIQNFAGTNGAGIRIATPAVSTVTLSDVTINNTGSGSGAGINIAPVSNTGSARVSLTNVRIDQSTAVFGIRADVSTSGSGGIALQTDNVRISGNSGGLFLFAGASANPIKAMITNTLIANNTNTGLTANGAAVTALVSNTTITNNGQGVISTGATVLSYQDNRLFGNTTNNTFPATIMKN